MKILLAEDASGMRKIIGTMLKGFGFTDVVTAETGADALQIMRQARFDLLLTNWDLPVMNGVELVRQLRLDARYANLPVLMITSRGSRQDVVAAGEVGVDDYILKPFSPSQLKDHVYGVLGRRARHQAEAIEKSVDVARAEDEYPLILIGDAASSQAQLVRPENRRSLDFLSGAAAGAGRENARTQDPCVGLLIESDTTRISALMRAAESRIKALFVTTLLPGGGLTLTRLASVNRRSDLSVFLVCESTNDLTPAIRQRLDRLGISLMERGNLDTQALEQLFDEHVLAKVHEARPSELPSPSELRQRLEMDIRLTGDLPVLPHVFSQIASLSSDPESDMAKWAEAVETDPLSRARVIHRARSPLHGFRGDINEASQAVVLLGKNVVKEIIVSDAVQRAFNDVQADSFSVEEYWSHSIAVGVTARALACPLEKAQRTAEQETEFAGLELSDDALEILRRLDVAGRLPLRAGQDPFVAGMMHDIGKVALAHSYPGLHPLVLEELLGKGWNIPMSYAEETYAGGADHALVGRILAESWRLGEDTVAVAEYHHQPDPGDHLTLLVALANFVAGGLYPFPQVAQYPLVRLLAEPPGEALAQDDADGQEPDPRVAAGLFVPPAVLEVLGAELDDLVALTRHLAPTVRKLCDGLRDRPPEGSTEGSAAASGSPP